LPTESNNEITGTWSPSTISTKTAGTTTYTFTPATGQCAALATVKVTVQSCAKTELVATAKVTPDTASVEEASGPAAIVYPNPSISAFNLQLRSNKVETIEIMVMDLMGHTLYHTRGDATGTYQFGGDFIKGMYFVEILHSKGIKTLKVIKQ
jgi:hypothetical protein